MPWSDPAGMVDLIARLLKPTGAGEYVRRQVVSKIINAACPLGGQVVDLGAGVGNLYTALRPDLHQGYVVVDMAPGRFGRRIIGDVTAIPLLTESADFVCLSDVLEHLVRDVDAVQEAVRITRPGACVVIHVPSTRKKPYAFLQRAADGEEAGHHQQFPHVRDGYTHESLTAMLNEVVGIDLLSVEPSFSAAQSLVTDVDAYLWWHKWTVLRPATWLGIRIASRQRPGMGAPASSSGYVAVLRKCGAVYPNRSGSGNGSGVES